MPRADKKRNLDKIAASLAMEPLQTVREVAKSTGIGKTTVAEHMKKLDKIGQKDKRIVSLTDGDFDIMKRIQEIKAERLQEPDKVNNGDIDKREQTATKRYTLFRGNATDEEGGLIISPINYGETDNDTT